MQSNTAVSSVDIGKHRRPCSWTEIKKEAQSRESTLNAKRWSNSTREHTKTQGKTWNSAPVRNKARARWKLRHSPWMISPLKIFWGGQICNDEYPSKIPRMSISTVLWKRSLTNAIKNRERMLYWRHLCIWPLIGLRWEPIKLWQKFDLHALR